MAVIESRISTSSDPYLANREGMLALVQRARGLEARTRGASAAAKPRFEKRGQLLPRERLALALDPCAPFRELSTLAGYRLDTPDTDKSVPGGGLIAGIGYISGVRVMVTVSDSGIDAGAMQAMGLEKQLRIQELALENRLPFVQLVESAGANLLNYRVEQFIHGGSLFRNLARLSAAGLPVVTATHGSSTAGGAYQTGLSDYIIMVRNRSRAFLAGPPLLKAATGEIASEEELVARKCTPACPGWATTWPRTIATRCAWRARSWRASTGTASCHQNRAATLPRPATPPRNCSVSCRWTTSARST